jgi:hypothetical protein
MDEIEALTVNPGEPFTVIAVARGNTPFTFKWYLITGGNAEEIAPQAGAYLIDYSIDTPGQYVLAFEVTDANGLIGTKAIVLTVGDAPAPAVWVCDNDGATIDALTVPTDDPFTLRGCASGDAPFIYRWFQLRGGVLEEITSSGSPEYLADQVLHTTGYRLVILEATDANGFTGAGVVVVRAFWVPRPEVTIYDLNMNEIDALTVTAGEPFTLIGVARGDTPFLYHWFQIKDGVQESIADGTSYLIDHVISATGEYLVIFEVTNVYGYPGRDSAVVTVEAAPPAVLDVAIDIKPGSDPNSINLRSKGNVPVAIFSTPAFDATTIDPATVKLADAPVRVVGKKGRLQAAAEDVNGDGLMDLLVHIDTQALALAPGDVEAVLTGATYDGTPIRGSDAVQIVP